MAPAQARHTPTWCQYVPETGPTCGLAQCKPKMGQRWLSIRPWFARRISAQSHHAIKSRVVAWQSGVSLLISNRTGCPMSAACLLWPLWLRRARLLSFLPRPSPPSVPCRTSTTTIHAQCSLPDLNREYPRPVFPAGPQSRPSTPSVPCRTSTASIHAKRYAT